VSCWAKFEAIDPLNPLGPWRSVQEEWATGDFKRIAVEAAEDMGFSADGLISRVTSDLGDSGKLCRD